MDSPSLAHHCSPSTSASTIEPPHDTQSSSSPISFLRPRNPPTSSPEGTPNAAKGSPLLQPHRPHLPSSSHSSPGPDHAKLGSSSHSHSADERRSSSIPRRGSEDVYFSYGPATSLWASFTITPKHPDGYKMDGTAGGDDEQEDSGALSGLSLWGYSEDKRKATRRHVAKTVLALLTPESKQRLASPPTTTTSTPKEKGRFESAVDTGVDIAHELLTVSVDVLEFVPIPSLAACAKLLLEMWDSCTQVGTNTLSCLRLTQRSAGILLHVHNEVTLAGDMVAIELEQAVLCLKDAFTQVNNFLFKLARRPFLKRYLKRDEIQSQIQDCDKVLSDAMSIFGISVPIHVLRVQMEAGEARRQDPLAAPRLGRLPSLGQTGGSLLLGSSPGTSPQGGNAPYAPGSQPSAIQLFNFHQTQIKNLSPPTKIPELPPSDEPVKFPDGPDYIPYGCDPQWEIQFPLPPHQSPQPPPQGLLTVDDDTSSSQKLSDAQADQQHLRSLLRTVLGKGEAEIVDILQVRQDEIPEAIKTLRRALEQISDGDAPNTILPSIRSKSTTTSTSMSGSRATGALSGSDSFRGSDSRLSTSDTSQLVPEDASTTPRGDFLDCEFIETVIDALRKSQSNGVEISCPDWTITKYEISRQAQIGIGPFCNVYRGTYRSQSVFIKYLLRTTPHSLFVKEVPIWKKLRHSHVLELIGASSATGDPPWFLVSPYMKNGSLVSFLQQEKAHLTESDLLKMLHQTAKGMEYLHAEGVLHGDLKAANVLVDDHQRCVVADFGQSEMKSEAFRLIGAKHPHGTLQWWAPELLAGASWPTAEMDIFAFAMCCIEVLTFGHLPWGHSISDDMIRAYVTGEHRRPEIPTSNVSLQNLITQCWNQDPLKRPKFSRIVRDLKQLRLESGCTVSEEPVLPSLILEELSASHSPVPTSPDSNSPPYITVEGYDTTTTTASNTDDDDDDDDNIGAPHLRRLGPPERRRSPPPANKVIAAAKNERRYRISLRHDYHPSLRLPLWHPGHVSLGDVGYLSKPAGAFVTLFNCFDPTKTSNGRTSGMASLYGYAQDGKVNTGSHKEDKLNAVQRNFINAIAGMPLFHAKATDAPIHVSRRCTHPLQAGRHAAYLCTKSAVYQYIEEMDAPKSWFKANVDTILKLYSAEHRITKEELYLVIGTLEAANHAQFVSHRHPDGHVHFNIFSAPRAGQAWGSFTTDSNTTGAKKAGPSYPEEALANPKSASRISLIGGPPETVLVARLRFKTDALEPTSR